MEAFDFNEYDTMLPKKQQKYNCKKIYKCILITFVIIIIIITLLFVLVCVMYLLLKLAFIAAIKYLISFFLHKIF